jgi:hypothetical protein
MACAMAKSDSARIGQALEMCVTPLEVLHFDEEALGL